MSKAALPVPVLQEHVGRAQTLLTCRSKGLDLCIPVGVLHVAAFLMGYVLSKVVGFSEGVARTVSIETGKPSDLHSKLPPLVCLVLVVKHSTISTPPSASQP